jgi:hypothetical protein
MVAGIMPPRGKGLGRRSCKAMYATVRRYEGVPNPSEVARIVNEGFLPIMREIPGFVDYYFADAGDGVLISTSIFENSSGEEEPNWRAGEFVGQHLAPLLPNPPHITAVRLSRIRRNRRHTYSSRAR